ncbi:MAG: hypothetical protein CMH52_14355 [Myxococcales bacterium]|nr:hypothetical protein [Myxococcales bacterium]|tara:strand:- start:1843 stop:2172 length:330 start_codon:yes stop_codon:yes gene_type:complete
MPWFKSNTFDLTASGGSTPSATTNLLAGTSSEILIQISNKSVRTLSVSFKGLIDGTNESAALEPGAAVLMNADGFVRVKSWPYLKATNTGSASCTVSFYEWLEVEEEEI